MTILNVTLLPYYIIGPLGDKWTTRYSLNEVAIYSRDSEQCALPYLRSFFSKKDVEKSL